MEDKVILNTLTTSNIPEIRELAKRKLELLDQKKIVALPKDFAQIVEAINDLTLSIQRSAGIDERKLEQLINQRLAKFQITPNNISPELKTLIESLKGSGGGGGGKMVIQVNDLVPHEISTTEERRLYDVLLSDAEAKNNVYLYGEAGTGKTFMAGKIAKALNYKLFTLTCNQFTSPLDLIGGQTIEGYQEGILIKAWANLDMGTNKDCKPYNGALLLLDELPKLDPNTAGILNDALAKIKDGTTTGKDCVTGEEVVKKPVIFNGRQDEMEMQNIFIMATGNSKLNEANKDYEANFKQDLSLQDRFAGSCYMITYNYEFEYKYIMKHALKIDKKVYKVDLTFAFNFLAQLRQTIVKLELQGTAFVSTRLMIVTRDTYFAYLTNRESSNPIPRPKTMLDVIISFLSLFSKEQVESIKEDLGSKYDEFVDMCNEYNDKPLDELSETDAEQEAIAQEIISKAQVEYRKDNDMDL